MTRIIRWGILGTGNIARQFAEGLKSVPDAELVAVGSRSQKTADAFAADFNVTRAYASYEELAADPAVDVVYVSSPHPMHHDNTLLCLNGGKAVLCEKPFAINAAETRAMIDTARAKGLFLMEAMWTRYFPAMVRLRDLLDSGVIGDVRLLTADFGFRAEFDAEHRLFNPELGGGALLDVGIYPISLASMILGRPESITSTAALGQTGVDEQSAYLFRYPEGAMALLASAVRTETPHQAVVNGTHGRITIHRQFWRPHKLTVEVDGKEPEVIELPYTSNGYQYEAIEVGRCLRDGLKESPVMPLDETLALMETLDAIRAQWGLVYPSER